MTSESGCRYRVEVGTLPSLRLPGQCSAHIMILMLMPMSLHVEAQAWRRQCTFRAHCPARASVPTVTHHGMCRRHYTGDCAPTALARVPLLRNGNGTSTPQWQRH